MNILRYGVAGIGGRIAFLSVERRDLDRDRIHRPTVRDPDSGIDRVRMIFDRTDTGAISDQLNSINMYGFAGMIVGGVMGGLKYAQMANITFRERNEITVFDSQLAGKRKLQDATTLGFAKGAYRIGWRMGVFCWCFSGVSIAMNEYYNKPAISSYTVAGLVTGALYKFPLGPKGMISGGFFGTFIGTAAGALLVGALKLSGVSMKEIHRKQSEYFDLRDKSVWQIVPTQEESDAQYKISYKRAAPTSVDLTYDYLSELDEPDDGQETSNKSEAEITVEIVENVHGKTETK